MLTWQKKKQALDRLKRAVWKALKNHEFGKNLQPPPELKKQMREFKKLGFTEEQVIEVVAKELDKFSGDWPS